MALTIQQSTARLQKAKEQKALVSKKLMEINKTITMHEREIQKFRTDATKAKAKAKAEKAKSKTVLAKAGKATKAIKAMAAPKKTTEPVSSSLTGQKVGRLEK